MIAALIAAVALVISTFWQYGGRRAFERRAIHSELEILRGMPDGMAGRDELHRHIEDAIREYVAEPSPSSRSLGIPSWLIVGGSLLTSVGFAVSIAIAGDDENAGVPLWLVVPIVLGLFPLGLTVLSDLVRDFVLPAVRSIWRAVRR